MQFDQDDQYDKYCRPVYSLANSMKVDCEQSTANRTNPFHIDWCMLNDDGYSDRLINYSYQQRSTARPFYVWKCSKMSVSYDLHRWLMSECNHQCTCTFIIIDMVHMNFWTHQVYTSTHTLCINMNSMSKNNIRNQFWIFVIFTARTAKRMIGQCFRSYSIASVWANAQAFPFISNDNNCANKCKMQSMRLAKAHHKITIKWIMDIHKLEVKNTCKTNFN